MRTLEIIAALCLWHCIATVKIDKPNDTKSAPASGSTTGGNTTGASSGDQTNSTSSSSSGTASSSSGTASSSSGGSGSSGSAAGLRPNPIISRGMPVSDSNGVRMSTTHPINDGQYGNWGGVWRGVGPATAANPIWVSINLGSGLGDVLLVWEITTGAPEYCTTNGANVATDYEIQTSATSSDGSDDGSWVTVHTETGNQVRWREHRFSMAGSTWVRMKITSGSVAFDEIEVHDLSKGSQDTWIYLGSGDTRFIFDRNSDNHAPTFAMNINAKHSDHFPAMVDIAELPDNVSDAISATDCSGAIDDWLTNNPDMHFWVLDYGQKEATASSASNCDTSAFTSAMQTLIDKIEAAGHVAVLPHIPYANDGQHACIPAFNQAIDTLLKKNTNAFAGPNTGDNDLYAWFVSHNDEICQGSDNFSTNGCEFVNNVNLTDVGKVAINALWAKAMDALY